MSDTEIIDVETGEVQTLPALPATSQSADAIARRVEAEHALVHALKGLVTDRCVCNIQGRPYVTVAGLTAIARGMGYTVLEVSCDATDDGFVAVAEVHDENGRTVGRGSGFVGYDEKPWNTRPTYAQRAMASTRAAGRALRLFLAPVVIAMGYEATPAEEMPREPEVRQPRPTPPQPTPRPQTPSSGQQQANSEPPPDNDGDEGTSMVKVEVWKGSHKTGESAKGQWWMHAIKDSDGYWYQFFGPPESERCKLLEQANQSGWDVILKWKAKEYKGRVSRELLEVRTAEGSDFTDYAPDQGPPEPGSDLDIDAEAKGVF